MNMHGKIGEGMDLDDPSKAARFEQIVTPHVPAAWNLARWLVRDPNDAEDVLQEAHLRAFRFLDSYRGGDAKSWLLSIVRNLCHDLIRKNQTKRMTVALDEQAEMIESESTSPLERLERSADAQQLRGAMERLPVEYRETLVLREFEGLSYKQIAEIAGVPMGTVMSRLARGREQLVSMLAPQRAKEEGRR